MLSFTPPLSPLIHLPLFTLFSLYITTPSHNTIRGVYLRFFASFHSIFLVQKRVFLIPAQLTFIILPTMIHTLDSPRISHHHVHHILAPSLRTSFSSKQVTLIPAHIGYHLLYIFHFTLSPFCTALHFSHYPPPNKPSSYPCSPHRASMLYSPHHRYHHHGTTPFQIRLPPKQLKSTRLNHQHSLRTACRTCPHSLCPQVITYPYILDIYIHTTHSPSPPYLQHCNITMLTSCSSLPLSL